MRSVVPADAVLESMVDEGDLDGLFAQVTIDDVAAAWCRYSSRVRDYEHHDDDRDWWARSLFMSNEIYLRSDLHRALLLKLVEYADEPGLLAAVGGPRF